MDKLTPAQKKAQDFWASFPKRSERIFNHFLEHLIKENISNGTIVEIGGRENPIKSKFDATKYKYINFDLEENSEDVVVADITYCPQIPSNYCDAVYSVDVFEHINRPWRAADEISRILKPGGIVYTSTLFSWRYHPCPIDYWRFTPDCLKFLFERLETLECGFDDLERRRNIVGNGKNKLKEDDFGGWRENWRVFHIGRKPGTRN